VIPLNRSANLFILTTGLFALATIVLSIGARIFDYFPGDLWFSQTIQSTANPTLTVFMKGLSWIFGDWQAVFLVAPAVLLTWWKAGFAEGFLVILASLLSLICNVLKIIIDRPRPSPDLVNIMMPYHGNGFPSGHAFFSVLFLGILTYLFFYHLKRTAWRFTVIIVAVLLILLIGISRVYLGLHWASDVLGGWAFGGMFLFLLIGLAPYIKKGRDHLFLN
jgi:membrane-associated phospholipid phosphatase